MPILPDFWIRETALNKGMIEPFVDRQNHTGVISYGLSSYGYDARVAPEFKIFTNVDSAVVDPKNFSQAGFVERNTDVCIIPPNSFALARTVEYFRIPRDVMVRNHCECYPSRARMGRACDIGIFQYHTAPRQNLRQ
jgi:dCTP deaminase